MPFSQFHPPTAEWQNNRAYAESEEYLKAADSIMRQSCFDFPAIQQTIAHTLGHHVPCSRSHSDAIRSSMIQEG